MFGIVATNMFDSGVIDNKTERYWAGFMCEETGCVFGGMVTIGGKVFDKTLVGKDACLWEAMHAFENFNHDIAVVYKGFEVILFHDGGWNG